MTAMISLGTGLIFMKVGTHAQEPLAAIIARKSREIAEAGHAFWGYGGNTCHPQTMVQPFATAFEQQGKTVYLCMQPMQSKHFAPQVRADEYSVDGITWQLIEPAINALGSRYALVVKNLREEQFDLPLRATRVAIGNSIGSSGTNYIRGRVDKACLEVTQDLSSVTPEEPRIHIGLVAELTPPYAVYLRNIVS
jgi:hypothetical protein